MLKEAQGGNAFYVGPNDWRCVERFILGMEDPEPILVSGIFGGEEGLFKETRSCRAMYHHLPKMLKGSVQYVAFAPIDKLTFDPDVLVITANTTQAQTILRAVNYSTGEPFISKATPVVACSWIYVYPVISGAVELLYHRSGDGHAGAEYLPAGAFLNIHPLPATINSFRKSGRNEL